MKPLKAFLFAMTAIFCVNAFAAAPTLIMTNNFGEKYTWSINGGNSPAGISLYGVYVQRLSVGFAALNTAGSAVALNLGSQLPNKAIIKQVYYNVTTTFVDNGTSGDADTSTLSIGANSAVDLKAAIAISNGANPWDAGIGAGIPINTAASMVKTTAARFVNITWTHGSGNSTALTAGAMDIFVEYVIGE